MKPDIITKKLSTFHNNIQSNKYARLMRLDKPVGIYLPLLPALWAIGLGSTSWLQLIVFFILFSIGAVIMRGAGCVINDLIDKNIDALVKRTKLRPLASKEVSVKKALIFLAILLAISLAILVCLPKAAIILGIICVILSILYPFMKRITYYPQIFLGVVFNMGALIGWYSVQTGISYPPVIIYVACIFWTIGYDTIYAYQDRADDIKHGIKSLAVKLRENGPRVIWNLYLFMITMLGITGFLCYMNILYFLSLACALYILHWQTTSLDINDPKDCADKFQSNVKIGFIILAGILLGKF